MTDLSIEHQPDEHIEAQVDRHQFHQVQDCIFELGLSTSELVVYYALMTFANWTTRDAWPSIARLAEMTGLSRRTVINATAGLEAMRLLSVKRHKPSKRETKQVNRYIIHDASKALAYFNNLYGAKNTHRVSAEFAPTLVQNLHPNYIQGKQESKDSPQHANATAGQQSANHASLPMESSLLETDALTDAPAKEPIPLEENTTPDQAPMPESQAPAEPSPLEEAKPMESGAPEKKARKLTPAQLRSNALLTALGTAPDMATKAEGKRAGQVAGELNTIYKRARSEDMTPADVTAFVEYVKKQAGGQWTVTANSLLMNGRFAGWMEARAKAAARPAPVASSAAYDELMSLRGA